MKKINILLSLLALSFVVTSCGKEPGVDSLGIDDSASYYLRDTKIVAPSENVSEPVFVDSVKSGNSLFVQYKLGTIKKSFIEKILFIINFKLSSLNNVFFYLIVNYVS